MAMKILLTIVVGLLIIGAVFIWHSLNKTRSIGMTSNTDHILSWQDRTTIETQLGQVTGLSNQRVNAFLGIPYGLPPTGDRRFMPPEPVQPWKNGLDATSLPNICYQGEAPTGPDSFTRSEDCLYLNIFMPAYESSNRPVLFWIHGGSFNQGSANDYDGSVLAEQGDVVVVVINYRLGFFGFLDLSMYDEKFAGSAANGHRDQILALRWVQSNIADYGGDPGNVTIFGESAGATSVLSIMAAPSADGLYHKAIAHSGSLVKGSPPDHTKAFADHLGVDVKDVATRLRALSEEEMFEAQQAVPFGGGGKLDGTVVNRSSNEAILEKGREGVPLIAGFNRDEGTLFSYLIPSVAYGMVGEAVANEVVEGVDGETFVTRLKKAYPNDSRKEHFERIWSEMFKRGASNSAVRSSVAGAGGWLYRFDLPVQKMPELGATHAAEISFTFNAYESPAPQSAYLYDKHDPIVRELALN